VKEEDRCRRFILPPFPLTSPEGRGKVMRKERKGEKKGGGEKMNSRKRLGGNEERKEEEEWSRTPSYSISYKMGKGKEA